MNTIEKTLANGTVYLTCDYLSFGDYDNSCAVERANVRYLKEHNDLKDSIESFSMSDWDRGDFLSSAIENRSIGGFPTWVSIDTNEKLIETYGGYGSIKLWVRKDIWDEMVLEKELDSYPALSDDLVSQIEMDMENEAWDNWVKSDLIRTLPDELTDEQFSNQEVKCLNCCWEGIVSQLKEELGHNGVCPNCHNPYVLKFYPDKTYYEFADELDNETLWCIYRYCCENVNEYGHVESGGNWYIDIDKMKECFKLAIEQYYNGNEIC